MGHREPSERRRRLLDLGGHGLLAGPQDAALPGGTDGDAPGAPQRRQDGIAPLAAVDTAAERLPGCEAGHVGRLGFWHAALGVGLGVLDTDELGVAGAVMVQAGLC